MEDYKPCKVYCCGLDAAVDVVGGKWKPVILWGLSTGPRRFADLRRVVVGISEKMLSQQLRELMADCVVSRKDFQVIPPHVEYSLTPFGESLLRALGPLCDWGTEHMTRIGQVKAGSEARAGSTPAAAKR
jgi:DNA-binding HxlR family transcriptional regulator